MNSTRRNPNHITRQDLADVLTTALEGGVNYWAGGIEVDEYPKGAEYGSEVPAYGGSIVLLHDDPQTGDDGDFTARSTIKAANLLRGIRKAAAHRGRTVERFMEEHDAEGADIAVQFAIFGEIIFG